MKTAIVFTGGTIGSAFSDGYLRTENKTKESLLNLTDGGVEIFEPYYINSEQLDGEYLTKLISCVGDRLKEGYDGIIVTHGTDTLQYAAAALALAFGDCDIPVVIVSANYILSDRRSNGRDNFNCAVKFIERRTGGVYVSYRNTGEHPAVFRASELLAHDAYSDTVRTVGGRLGYLDGDNFIFERKVEKEKGVGAFSLGRSSPILWLRAYPGMKLPDADGYKAVLFETYHSGTLPTDDKDFREFCGKCKAKLFAVGVPEGVGYISTSAYNELNIVVIKKYTPIYAYISLWKDCEKNIGL